MPTTLLATPPSVPWPTDRLVTADEMMRHPEWGNCELIYGKVNPVCRPNNEHGLLAAELTFHLRAYSGAHKLGYVFSNDSGILISHEPDTVRGPDVHFVSSKRWPGKSALKTYLEIAPDLCVEILSPNDIGTDIEEKIIQFQAIGVKRVWVINPKARTARVYREDGASILIPASGSLSGEDIFPGFELALKDLFAALD